MDTGRFRPVDDEADLPPGQRAEDEGTRAYPDGPEWTKDATETYSIAGNDPPSARARSQRSARPHRPDLPWDTTVQVRPDIVTSATPGSEFREPRAEVTDLPLLAPQFPLMPNALELRGK